MKTITIELDDYRAVVRRATVRDGVTHDSLAAAEVEDDMQSVHGIYAWVACVTEFEGVDNPISFDAFCDLPDELVVRAFDAVCDLNQHWFKPRDTEAEKKALASPTDSTDA